jgi:hypothetical protein
MLILTQLTATLHLDLPTSQGSFFHRYDSSKADSLVTLENASKSTVYADDPYDAFHGILDCATEIVAYFLQLYIIIQSADSLYGGLIFALLCLSKQLIQMKTLRYLWYESTASCVFFSKTYSMYSK